MKKQRILFVDDMKQVYDKFCLHTTNESQYAESLEKALELINKNNYDLVITDYHLGDNEPKGGLKVIREAKKKGLEVLSISTENRMQEVLEAGADKFMFKKEFLEELENGR